MNLRVLCNFIICMFVPKMVKAITIKECSIEDNNLSVDELLLFSKTIVPNLDGKQKGDAGKIGVIGGSIEYTGAPYFAALAALKVGADLVYVITTESAAPVIKTYSPDLIVYPFLSTNYASKINALLHKMDVIIIGPGIGREEETLKLIYDLIKTCYDLHKPLVIDADGLYALSKNISILQNYPAPGAILTPNHQEADKLMQAISKNNSAWYYYWGDYVTVLVKGQPDKYYSSDMLFDWSSSSGGSSRRAGGQGDILSGSLGTLYNWALKSNLCENEKSVQLAQSVATYAAAIFTRECNAMAYLKHGRSLTASDMLNYIHSSFDNLFL